MATIYIGHGKVMLNLPDAIRKPVLVKIKEIYHINITNEEILKFKNIDIIAMPVDSLKSYIDGYYNNNSYHDQIGVRIDSSKNELANWISESAKTYKDSTGIKLRFCVCADGKEGYPQVKRVFDILGDQGIHHFYLTTWSKHEHIN